MKSDLQLIMDMGYKMGRRGMATELNADYFRDGVGYLKLEETKLNEPSLFDFADITAGA